jgi:hypothetical protein
VENENQNSMSDCCCLLFYNLDLEASCVGMNITIDIDRMNEARLTKHISDVEDEDMKKLWLWYGLNLMVDISRKDWPWKNKQIRLIQTFSNSVTVGDEALVLQIIKLRGKVYVELRDKKAAGGDVKLVKGRKRACETSQTALSAKFAVYKRMRDMVKRIRTKNPNDEFGWDGYLMDQMNLMNYSVSVDRSVEGGTVREKLEPHEYQDMDILLV